MSAQSGTAAHVPVREDAQAVVELARAHPATPFAIAAALALGTIPLPPHPIESGAYFAAVGAFLVVLIAWLLAGTHRVAGLAPMALVVAYLSGVALLRHAEGGALSSLGPLVMLPVFWVALYRSRRELAFVTVCVTAVFLIPTALIGAPDYPAAEVTRALVWLLVAGTGGFVVHNLVEQIRRGRTDALAQASALAESERRNDELIALVSHDLKNPLSSIAAAAGMLADNDDAGDRRLAAMIEGEARRTMRLVDDLLTLGQVRAGRLVLRQERLDLIGLLASRIEAAGPLAAGAGVRLQFSGSESIECSVDADRICAALDNLIYNAIKFTPAGGLVTVSAGARAKWVEIQVLDTGCGIPEGEHSRVFSRFYQARRGTGERPGGGTGLGLSIADATAELHGGSLSLESAVGAGTRMTMTLPAEPRVPCSTRAGRPEAG